MSTDTNTTTTDKLDLATLVLRNGGHNSPDDGLCVMEAVAYFAGEPHSDHPACACKLLTKIAMRWNDNWNDEERQKLKPLIPMLVGTRGSRELTIKRGWFIVDKIIRWHFPQFLRELPNKPRPDIAERIESLSPIIDRDSAERARDLARTVRKELEGSWKSAAAADADAYAAAAAAAYAYADAYAYAAARQKLRASSIDRLVSILREACAITEASA